MFSLIGVDKLLHFTAFAILGLLTPMAFRTPLTRALGVLALATLSVSTEFGQRLLPWRAFSPGDMAADLLGLAAGVLLGIRAARRLYSHLEQRSGCP